MSGPFLVPGDYYFGVPEHPITTLLASCVSLVAWHPERHLTLVSHVILPQAPEGASGWDPRYADVMMDRWLSDLRSVRAFPIEFRIGLFGGSSRFFAQDDYRRSIGYRNVAQVRWLVDGLGIAITKEDTGGCYHRKLVVDGQRGCYGVQLLGHPQRVAMEVATW